MKNLSAHYRMPLRLVDVEDRFSIYADLDGEEVYLAHGSAKVLVNIDDLNLQDLWEKYLRKNDPYYRYGPAHYTTQHGFMRELEAMLIDPDEVDEWSFCADCHKIEHSDDRYTTGPGDTVCEHCYEENYSNCDDCEEPYRSGHMTTTLSDDVVCNSCRASNWTYCDHCDGYRSDNSYDHDHDDDEDDENWCGCEAPAQSFVVRNGTEDLKNDTSVHIGLPAGVISEEGLVQISSYLRFTVAYDERFVSEPGEQQKVWGLAERVGLGELGDEWQTRDGNFTKRLSRFAYKEYGIKLQPEWVSHIGCVARDHSQAVDFTIEVTRALNGSPEDFGHEDSCWWQSYTSSRCALKNNGGFGLRSFHVFEGYQGSTVKEVTGRAWVMPLRLDGEGNLVPTFETAEPDAFIVFNGYGALSGYGPARIVSHMAGMTYRKVVFTCAPMYINSEAGYLVAPEEIAENYTDGSLHLDTDAHANLFTIEKGLTNVA